MKITDDIQYVNPQPGTLYPIGSIVTSKASGTRFVVEGYCRLLDDSWAGSWVLWVRHHDRPAALGWIRQSDVVLVPDRDDDDLVPLA